MYVTELSRGIFSRTRYFEGERETGSRLRVSNLRRRFDFHAWYRLWRLICFFSFHFDLLWCVDARTVSIKTWSHSFFVFEGVASSS